MTTTHRFYTEDDYRMVDLNERLVDAGLTHGLLALAFTPGVSITAGEIDVVALAALRLLTSLPQHVEVREVIDGLTRRAAALSTEVQ